MLYVSHNILIAADHLNILIITHHERSISTIYCFILYNNILQNMFICWFYGVSFTYKQFNCCPINLLKWNPDIIALHETETTKHKIVHTFLINNKTNV